MLVRSRVEGAEIILSQDCPGCIRCTQRCHSKCVASLYATNTTVQSVAVLASHAWKNSERAEMVYSQPSCKAEAGWRGACGK
eukprot:6195395-Pleurochrysis_carterae.AAC.2